VGKIKNYFTKLSNLLNYDFSKYENNSNDVWYSEIDITQYGKKVIDIAQMRR